MPEGRILGLLGKNGTGKTTTINILSGYLEPRKGECLIFGENIRSMNPATRARIGLLIEGHVQYQFMTIRQIERFYSAFYPQWRKDAYYELMAKLKVAPGQRIANMSCGQRSQVALGLILAQNPDLLVLDDFSLGLDPGYRRLFVEYLREYAKAEGKTVFLTSHIIQDMERLVDDCIIMDYGRILLQCPVAQILSNFRIYRCQTDEYRNGEALLQSLSQAGGGKLYHPSLIRQNLEFGSFLSDADLEFGSFLSDAEVGQILRQEQIGYSQLRSERVGLEDAFLSMTGKY